MLVNAGANPNAKAHHNYTPLHLAAEYGNLGNAKILLESDASAKEKDIEQRTPFQ
jgi:ankyrin repeat protein